MHFIYYGSHDVKEKTHDTYKGIIMKISEEIHTNLTKSSNSELGLILLSLIIV